MRLRAEDPLSVFFIQYFLLTFTYIHDSMYIETAMRRTKEEAAITREQLLKKALAVFSKKGYAATTLQNIAHEADVTRGAIYHHFGGKAELYNTLIREYSCLLYTSPSPRDRS